MLETLLPEVATPDRAVRSAATSCLRRPEVWLEIGFGGGEHLVAQAARRPDVLSLGAEPFVNGVASALRHIEEAER